MEITPLSKDGGQKAVSFFKYLCYTKRKGAAMFFETQITSEKQFQGRIVHVRQDTAKLHTGAIVPREVVEHSGGVCIIPMDHNKNCYLVEQFRYPFGKMLLEFPAGRLEIGEDPKQCALRELSEETGFLTSQLIDLGPMYPSPGYLTEVIHLYLALDLTAGKAHPDENEYVNLHKIPLDTLLNKVSIGELPDAKTQVGLLRLKLFLEGGLYGK